MNQVKSIAPTLLVIFSIFWILLAINPFNREVWAAENTILIICFYYLINTYSRFKLSNASYLLIFTFCILQTIGAHYSYTEVPLGFWVSELFEIERNHYDRLVHFAFGFLIVLPFKEVLIRFVKFTNQRTERTILVLLFIGIGGCYEIIEWWYALAFEQGVQANDFLGSQGDIWDAEKDVFLAGLGAWIYLFIFSKNKP